MRVRTFLLLLGCLALLLLLGAVALLRPVQVTAEIPLTFLVPGDATCACRGNPDRVLGSPLARVLAASEPLRELRARLGWEDGLVDGLTRASGGDATGTARLREVLGHDVILAGDGERWLLLARPDSKALLVGRLLQMDTGRLREAGLVRDGEFVRAEHGGLWASLTSQAVIVSSSEDWARHARAVAEGEVAPDPRDSNALGGDSLADATDLRVWADVATLLRDTDAPRPGTGAAFLHGVLPPERLLQVAGFIDTTTDDALVLALSGHLDGPPQDVLAGLSPSRLQAASFLGDAASLAIPGEALVVAAAPARPADVLLGVVHGQPEPRRRLVRQVLAEAHLTAEQVANDVGARFTSGVGLVVARLQEVDDLSLDAWDDGAVLPVPATVFVFRMAEGVTDADVLDDLERFGRVFTSDPLVREAVAGPGGARLHTATANSLGPAWRLLHPCVAFVDGLCLVSTNEAYLRRALEHRVGHDPGPPVTSRTELGGDALQLKLYADALRRYVADQRWEYAERATNRDWVRVRRGIAREIAAAHPTLPDADRELRVEDRMDEVLDRRNQVEFPAAVAQYRADWAWLAALGEESRADGWLSGRTIRLRMRVSVAR